VVRYSFTVRLFHSLHPASVDAFRIRVLPTRKSVVVQTRCLRHRLLTHVAVGIRIAPYPPHGSQRADFPHWALAVGRDARTARSWTPRFGLWVKSGVRLADLAVVPPCFPPRASQHGALDRLDSISFRSFAVRRIQASALGALFRLRVRNAFCWPRFPLARPLPSISSATFRCCSETSPVLWVCPTSPVRSSSAPVRRLPDTSRWQ
jgi:hypothetical protein